MSINITDFDRDGNTAESATYYDFRPDGFLNDAERDEDADGLTNWAETRGCLGEGKTGQSYWTGLYDEETQVLPRLRGHRARRCRHRR